MGSRSAIETASADPRWASLSTSVTGAAFAALFYFVCCYGMSRYAARAEMRMVRRGRH